MTTLSIIIPVYRVEDTLERCLQSVASQDYTDMEIILVDDGSPDRCPQICDEWAARDKRIRVIHKTNGGLSDARNAGIGIATGRYITFVDSDDYIEKGTYSRVMRTMKDEYDILEYSAELHIGGNKHTCLNLPNRVYADAKEYWLKGKAYTHTYAWNKIYRAELFKKVRFPVGKVFEDAHALPLLLKQTQVIATTDAGRYCYCANPNGITATADGKALASLLEAHTSEEITDRDYYMYVLNIQLDVYRMTNNPIRLNPLRITGFKGLGHKEQIKAFLLNTLGLNNLCRLYRVLYRIRNCRS